MAPLARLGPEQSIITTQQLGRACGLCPSILVYLCQVQTGPRSQHSAVKSEYTYSSIESADRDTMAASERAESSSRGNLGKYFNPWLSNPCSAGSRTENRWTRFTFCKMRAFNRLTLEQNMFSAQMLHNFTLKFEFNQSSPSRAICSNCSGRAVHIPQNFQISRELFKK